MQASIAKFNTTFLRVQAERINSLVSDRHQNLTVEFEGIIADNLFDHIARNITPITFRSGCDDSKLCYEYVCDLKRDFEESYEPEYIGLKKGIYDMIFDMTEQEKQQLETYLKERTATK
jgi:hypothetical protein